VIEGSMIVSQDRKRLIRYFGCESQVLIKKEIEVIGERCFSSCGSLSEVIFERESKLQRIEKEAFSPGIFAVTGLKKMTIPSSVEVIGEYCFYSCESLCEVTFERGSKLQRIEKEAFSPGIFAVTGLKKITIPSSVEVIGENSFSWCRSLSEVTFERGSKLQRIEELAFYLTGLKKITIPSSVEVIGENCFQSCESLCEVTFEGSVRGLAKKAFDDCPLQVVRVPVGEKLNVNLPPNCRIEYFEVKKTSRPATNISDLIIDLDSK
jgi:hypothetical protein